jgi:hypothetical protein
MSVERWMIRRLIGLYPASWQAEYGQELEALLAQRGLTFWAALDVAWGALVQRLRYVGPWKICAGFLLICRTAALVWNSVHPFSNEVYVWFTNGICLVRHFGQRFEEGFPPIRLLKVQWEWRSSVMLPDFVVCLLWASEFVSPVILPGGAAGPHGGGVALLHVRSSGPVDLRPEEIFIMEAVATCLGGAVIGALGGAAGARLSANSASR